MMFKIEMYFDLSYSLVRAWADTIVFLGCSNRRMTSSTVVFRMVLVAAASCSCSIVRGV